MKVFPAILVFLFMSAPLLGDERFPLKEATDKVVETTGDVLGDLLFRFHKCAGDLAVLRRRGVPIETLSKPYAVFDGMIVAYREDAIALGKSLAAESEYSPRKHEWTIWRLLWRGKILASHLEELKGKTKDKQYYRDWSDAMKDFAKESRRADGPELTERESLRAPYWTLLHDLPKFRAAVKAAAGSIERPALVDDLEAVLETLDAANGILLKEEMKKSAVIETGFRRLRLVTALVDTNAPAIHEEAMDKLGEKVNTTYASVLGLGEYAARARKEILPLIRPVRKGREE